MSIFFIRTYTLKPGAGFYKVREYLFPDLSQHPFSYFIGETLVEVGVPVGRVADVLVSTFPVGVAGDKVIYVGDLQVFRVAGMGAVDRTDYQFMLQAGAGDIVSTAEDRKEQQREACDSPLQ